jgi:hypothetical protein
MSGSTIRASDLAGLGALSFTIGGGGWDHAVNPNNSTDAKLQMGKLLKRACQYCGAISGDYARAELGSF